MSKVLALAALVCLNSALAADPLISFRSGDYRGVVREDDAPRPELVRPISFSSRRDMGSNIENYEGASSLGGHLDVSFRSSSNRGTFLEDETPLGVASTALDKVAFFSSKHGYRYEAAEVEEQEKKITQEKADDQKEDAVVTTFLATFFATLVVFTVVGLVLGGFFCDKNSRCRNWLARMWIQMTCCCRSKQRAATSARLTE